MSTTKILFTFIYAYFLLGCVKKELIDPISTPESNYELLCKLVEENYCFFEYKNINWDSIETAYRPKIKANMQDQELFDVLGDMLRELKDGHVTLASNFGVKSYLDWFFDRPQNFNFNVLLRSYLGKDFISVRGFQAQKLNNIGYIYYGSFMNTISDQGLKKILDQFGAIDGLIIDVRNNYGGALIYADTLAAPFFKTETLVGYTLYKTGPGRSDFTAPQSIRIKPNKNISFHKKVVILTNRSSYSATNAFASYMKENPNVTIIGDTTGGGGGMAMTQDLYNGWTVDLSKNPILSAKKEHIEWGVAPHKVVNIDPQDEAKGIDTIIEEAIFYLSGRYYKK